MMDVGMSSVTLYVSIFSHHVIQNALEYFVRFQVSMSDEIWNYTAIVASIATTRE
jgi:hypothetical protein